MVIDRAFWSRRRVFITGHTGFKGSWLSLWLHALGAEVSGFALPPDTAHNLFTLAGIGNLVRSTEGDIRDQTLLRNALRKAKPQMVFHLAAQPLVRRSYADPVQTFETNVLGTVYLLDAVRELNQDVATLVITSDKCYDNQDRPQGYRENDPMGGDDPYSASKGCAELVITAFRKSYFAAAELQLASARAGNVIGGGDWAEDRLIPDMVRAFGKGDNVVIRNPRAVRPWQHVLDCLYGYILLAQKLVVSGGEFARSWNFGPMPGDSRTVEEIVKAMADLWGHGARWSLDDLDQVYEAPFLALNSDLARARLNWRPQLGVDQALAWTVDWYRAHQRTPDLLQAVTLSQIQRHMALLEAQTIH